MLLEELKGIIKATVDADELNEMNDLTRIKILTVTEDFFIKNIRNVVADEDEQIKVETKMLNDAISDLKSSRSN